MEPTLTTFFTFDFYNEDLEQSTMMRFEITGPKGLYEKFLGDVCEQEYYFNTVSDAEGTFGVHDVSAHPGDLEGFTSYEIEPDQYMECMEIHQKAFKALGFEVGPINQIVIEEDGSEDLAQDELERRNEIWDELDAIRTKIYDRNRSKSV
jgi:hypothetical protein